MARAVVAAVAALLLASCTAVIRQPAEFDEPRDGVARIRGTLEDSETDTGRAGEVRAYRREADGSYTLLDADITDGAGMFALSFPEGFGEFDLQARLKDGAADAGYVRTITLPMRSASGLLVRAVPYTGLNGNTVETDITVERFREYIIEIMDREVSGLFKWRTGEPKGIEVLHEYRPPPRPPHFPPCEGWVCEPGTFTADELDAIEKVLTSEEGRALFGGREVPIQIDGPSTPDADKHYSYFSLGGAGVDVHLGWIVIFPSRYTGELVVGAAGATGLSASPYRGGGMIVLRIDDKQVMAQYEKYYPGFFRLLVLHELGHVTYSRHTTLHPLQSIMAPPGLLGQPRSMRPSFADRKALKISYEETFRAGGAGRRRVAGAGVARLTARGLTQGPAGVRRMALVRRVALIVVPLALGIAMPAQGMTCSTGIAVSNRPPTPAW